MINTTTPFPHPRFAGKKAQNKPSVFKTALIGSLLASAGAGASLTGTKPTQDKNALTQASPVGADQNHRALALTQGKQTDWDALILAEPSDAFEAGSEDEKEPADLAESKASQRKLLNTNASRTSGRRPYAAAVSPSISKEKAAQTAWNASSLTPLNYELFSKVTYPFTKPMKPAPLKPYTEARIKAELIPFLNKITGGNTVRNAQAMAVFNDPILKKKTNNDPKIRAMLASLQAMGFGAVVNTYKSNRFSTLKFHPVPFQDATGYSVRFNNETQQQIWLNPRYQGEDWKHLIDTVLHEALHDDTKVGNAEELINTAMDSLVGTKVRLLEPKIVTQNTELSRRLNTASLYRMLSRGPNGELRMNSTKPNVLPLRNFGARYGISKPADVRPSPGNPLLASLLKTFTGKTVRNPNFDWNTIQLLDQNQKYLSYDELLQAARLLQLNVMVPRTPRSIPRSMMELTENSDSGPTFTELDPEEATDAPLVASAAETDKSNAPKRSRRFLT